MDKATDPSAIASDNLAAMLRAAMDRIDTITRSASEKFKQSEAADWNDDLYQEGQRSLVEAEELYEDHARIADELPFLMKWASNSGPAIERKLQTIKNLWIEAVEQIPTGEGGLIYLTYEEGHRPSLADARTDAIRKLADTIYFKRRAISVPMTVITRLFPNVVLEGRADLIESVIPLVTGDKENYDFWKAEMPTRIFTP